LSRRGRARQLRDEVPTSLHRSPHLPSHPPQLAVVIQAQTLEAGRGLLLELIHKHQEVHVKAAPYKCTAAEASGGHHPVNLKSAGSASELIVSSGPARTGLPAICMVFLIPHYRRPCGESVGTLLAQACARFNAFAKAGTPRVAPHRVGFSHGRGFTQSAPPGQFDYGSNSHANHDCMQSHGAVEWGGGGGRPRRWVWAPPIVGVRALRATRAWMFAWNAKEIPERIRDAIQAGAGRRKVLCSRAVGVSSEPTRAANPGKAPPAAELQACTS
jgi:hypothetical protein